MNQVTFTEREAIRKMLDYIEAERERLFNQSLTLLDRLHDLDQIDKPEIVETPEIDFSVKPGQIEPNYSHREPCNLMDVSVQELIEKQGGFPHEERDLIPKTEIEALKDWDRKSNPVKTPTRNSSYRDVKVVAQYIKAILKAEGVPIKTSDLIAKLKETGIDATSPYVLLAQATKYEPSIQKAKFGYYQYKW